MTIFTVWPDLIQKSKEEGLDVIDTYVFWNLHEPVQVQCLEDTKERIKNMFNKVELSISSCDTAWVAMIPSPTSPYAPFFPSVLNWLLDNQLFDALLSTLACILALKQWGIGEDKMNRGLQFIESNITSINDEKQHLPIGFDILYPSLIEYAQNLGINLPIGASSSEAMIKKREIELQR
ncbi:Terpenoid cyclases/protein prenyltransferase alpha-alpha toroid [Sesbania bispinosa]|nr:Terpenoid cyclases/protein prenyltransferase alpha-alpha toroid [Sesbania bispinosa]